jgi:hypothetical protein
MTIGQLGHHPGLHVSVDVQGKTVGGVLQAEERWERGAVVGSSALGNFVTIELETPGNDLVMIDDATRVRPLELADVEPEGVPEEILELVRRGKTLEAIKRYRALNGASLDEAKAFIASLG